MIRLASRAAVAAILASGHPAMAIEALDAHEPSLAAAVDEWHGAVRFWGEARTQAERTIAQHQGEPLIVDDLTSALAYGDSVAATKEPHQSASRLHLLAMRLWAVISHCVNVSMRRPADI
jgi:hypothetical protein